MHAGEEDHERPGWTTSRRGLDSPWKSRNDRAQRYTEKVGYVTTSMVWPTLGSRTAKEQNEHVERTSQLRRISYTPLLHAVSSCTANRRYSGVAGPLTKHPHSCRDKVRTLMQNLKKLIHCVSLYSTPKHARKRCLLTKYISCKKDRVQWLVQDMKRGGVKYGVSNPRLGSVAKAPDVGLWAKSPATELLLSDYRPNVACNFT